MTVTVTYEGQTAQFEVTINEKKAPVLTGISLTAPEKSEYQVGDKLDLTGMKVIAVYDDGSEINVTDQAEVTGFDSSKAGDVVVSVSYGGFTENFTVSVAENGGSENPGEEPGENPGETPGENPGGDTGNTGSDQPGSGSVTGGSDQNAGGSQSGNGTQTGNSGQNGQAAGTAVKTADTNHGAVYGVLLAAAAAAAAVGVRRRIADKK